MTATEQPPAQQAPAFPLPRILTYQSSASSSSSSSSPPPTLVAQGAEARVYRTTYLEPDRPCALKYRPPKPYRHPVLDARLTRQRILAEARILHKCRREGVPVPALYAVDVEEDGADGRTNGGSLLTEWIEGGPVRARLNAWLATKPVPSADTGADTNTVVGGEEDLAQLRADPSLQALLQRMGTAVGSLHRVGVVHGDLTTSNLMLRTVDASAAGDSSGPTDGATAPSLDGDVVMIDFGLASQSSSDEDRAVDLYVLERAFGSTHPRAEALFEEVIKAYGQAFKQSGPVLRKLEDVRMRGRKRSMLG
ncbi:BUD32 protein kinase [Sporothrix schenckii ATCC 58251]|uniref:EKC/KEOPS complex subunit BUD32 n=1 Tax=Sporothrix schenckii (strain ATCC 58251 / de Perez 2211183) TaxID=1391915 RepID=U7Q166_SPOS1|nr:BUD32 protein kinase [Sporothrix schenckii ATCC 58251]